MFPGSGPSDRHNDILFPPIRAAFLAAGWAVASFDKRGVGGSSGDRTAADIPTQARDAIACLTACTGEISATKAGLFGHSQGGWVVLDAGAGHPAVDFIITNSGPGVSPRDQELFSTRQRFRAMGRNDRDIDAIIAVLGEMFDHAAAKTTWADAAAWMADPRRAGIVRDLAGSGAFVPTDEALWRLAGDILDHDPRPAMRRVSVPLLAVFGAADDVVPVPASVESFRIHVRPDLLQVAVIADGDHRVMRPGSTEFAADYPACLIDYLRHR
jgi:hypothetical protein